MTHSWLHGDSSHCRHYALICLSLSFPPLSHSGVQLGCLPSSPPPSLQGPDFVEPKLQKLTSWSWCSLPFLFVGLPVLPLWSGRSELTLWERLPDAQTAGEIILLFFAFVRIFFFLSHFLRLQRSSFPSVLFFHLLCWAAGLFWYRAKRIWSPRERSSSEKADLQRAASQENEPNRHQTAEWYQTELIPANLEKISCNIAPGCPTKKAWRSPQPAPRPPLWRKRRNVVGVGVWALVASRDWL